MVSYQSIISFIIRFDLFCGNNRPDRVLILKLMLSCESQGGFWFHHIRDYSSLLLYLFYLFILKVFEVVRGNFFTILFTNLVGILEPSR